MSAATGKRARQERMWSMLRDTALAAGEPQKAAQWQAWIDASQAAVRRGAK